MSGELVPQPEHKNQLITQSGTPVAPDSWGLRGGLPPIQTSLDVTTERGKSLLFTCMNGDCTAGKDVINREIEVVDYLLHPAETVDPESGEVSKWPRLCLIQPDDTVIVFGSQGVQKSLALLSVQYGPAPWNPPVRVLVKSRSIGQGRQWYYLDPLARRTDPPDRAKKIK